jgi:hypothetical protein
VSKKVAILDSATIVHVESAANGSAAPTATEEYCADVLLVGTTPLLMHRYDISAVKAKGKAAKNSETKKSDDLVSYLHRDDKGRVCIPGANLWSCLVGTAASVQDPRSPRKAAKELVKASLRIEPFLSPLLPVRKTWDYVDERRVLVQQSAVARQRPAFQEGWSVEFAVTVLAPEYIDTDFLHSLLGRAGRFNGLGDFRPLFGLFRVDRFVVRKLSS